MQSAQRKQSQPIHHPAWKILLAACCLYGATAGMINNCRGIFFAPAAASLGVSATEYALYLTFGCVTGVLSMPLVSKLFRTLPFKPILIGYLFLLGLSTSALGWVRTLHGCYAVGAVQGLLVSFVANYPAAYLVKQWFLKKKGLAMGIATASAGVVGAIMNIVYDAAIHSVGWRATYAIAGGGSFLLGALPVLLVVHRRPADLGLLPYGADSAADVPAQAAASGGKVRLRPKQLLPFVLIFFLHAVANLSNAYVQHVPNYALSSGLSSTLGASVLSIAMLAGVVTKLLYGVLADRIGIFRTAALLTAPIAVGFLLLLTGGGSAASMLLAGVCLCPIYSLIAIQGPLLLDAFYTGSAYESLLAVLITAAAIFTMGGNYIVDLMYTLANGDYRLGFAVMMGLLLLCIAIHGALRILQARESSR